MCVIEIWASGEQTTTHKSCPHGGVSQILGPANPEFSTAIFSDGATSLCPRFMKGPADTNSDTNLECKPRETVGK